MVYEHGKTDALTALGLIKVAYSMADRLAEMTAAQKRGIGGALGGAALGAGAGYLVNRFRKRPDGQERPGAGKAMLYGALAGGALGGVGGALHGLRNPYIDPETHDIVIWEQALDNKAPDYIGSAPGGDFWSYTTLGDDAARQAAVSSVSNVVKGGRQIKVSDPAVDFLYRKGREYTVSLKGELTDVAGRNAPTVVHGYWHPGDSVESVLRGARDYGAPVSAEGVAFVEGRLADARNQALAYQVKEQAVGRTDDEIARALGALGLPPEIKPPTRPPYVDLTARASTLHGAERAREVRRALQRMGISYAEPASGGPSENMGLADNAIRAEARHRAADYWANNKP